MYDYSSRFYSFEGVLDMRTMNKKQIRKAGIPAEVAFSDESIYSHPLEL